MGRVTIFPETTKNPITLIGHRAGICYGADVSNPAKNYERGLECIEAGHGRTLEFPEIHMMFEDYSAKVIREWYTHIGGAPTRLQGSTRYIDFTDFKYITPPTIAAKPEALAIYEKAMADIANAMQALKTEFKIPREDFTMLLPLGYATTIVDKRNVRNLIDMSRNRECSRAFWEYRNELFRDIKTELMNYSEEWKTLVELTFYPKCKQLGYCPETKSCHKYPKKRKVKKPNLEF